MDTFRQELNDFVATCDTLISLNAKNELSPAERAIIDYYLREMPVPLPVRKGPV